MSLSRAALVAELAASLAKGLTLAGMQPTDTADGLQPAVNAALRAMGVAEADLTADVPDGDERRAIAFARYFALRQIIDNATATEIDVKGGGGTEAKLSQAVAGLREQLAVALAEANHLGLGIPADGGSGPVIASVVAGGIYATPLFKRSDYRVSGVS